MSSAGINVVARINENAMPSAVNIAKLWSGPMGLVTSEIKPIAVVSAARNTATNTSLRLSMMSALCVSFVSVPPFSSASSRAT